MPKPVPIPVRRKLLQRAELGESTASLAAAFDLPPRTVRHLRKRFRDRGPEGILPDSHAPEDLPHAYPDRVRQAALALRRQHPRWGATLIAVALGQQRPKIDAPNPSTLRRWFRDAGLAPAPPPRRPRPRAKRASVPHDTTSYAVSEREFSLPGRTHALLFAGEPTSLFDPSLHRFPRRLSGAGQLYGGCARPPRASLRTRP